VWQVDRVVRSKSLDAGEDFGDLWRMRADGTRKIRDGIPERYRWGASARPCLIRQRASST
jgi:hypothetical protein